jgi:hypothetical protein
VTAKRSCVVRTRGCDPRHSEVSGRVSAKSAAALEKALATGQALEITMLWRENEVSF